MSVQTDSVFNGLLGDLPRWSARRWGERTALKFQDQSWSFERYGAEVERVAQSLLAWGVKPGDKVALWLNNSPQLQFLFFAIIDIGAVVVPLNTRYKASELRFALHQSGARFLFASGRSGPADYLPILEEALGQTGGPQDFAAVPDLQGLVMLDDADHPGGLAWSSFLSAGAGVQRPVCQTRRSGDDLAIMMFTSGTTGAPKGVLLNHAGVRLCQQRAAIMELVPEDVQLTYLPLFHIYAIGYSVIMSLLSGASQVLMTVFQADEAVRLIGQENVSVIHGFEAHFSDIMQAKARAGVALPSLRLASFATGSDAVKDLAEKVQTQLCPTLASYGLTEVWGGVTISPPSSTTEQRTLCSGVPQPDIAFRIVDIDSGAVLPPDQLGEIQIRGYSNMLGYYEDEEATRQAVTPDGWFRTGDAGILRSDGHLRYVARYKDMLKVGGENVSPAEIERIILDIQGIEAVAVVGQKDARLQEVPVAFVVKAAAAALQADDIIARCRSALAGFKVPRQVRFVVQLPMTSSGKVQKEMLRAVLSQ